MVVQQYVTEIQLSIINHVRVDICRWFMDITRNLIHEMGQRLMVNVGVWRYSRMEPIVSEICYT